MKIVNLFLIAAVGMAAWESGAVPVKFPECANSVSVTDVPGSAGYVLNEDCAVLYVLPALRGQLSVDGYRANRDIERKCAWLSNAEADSDDLQGLIRDSTKRLQAIMQEREELEENLREGLIPVGQTRETVRTRIKELLEDSDNERARIRKWQKENDEDKLRVANEIGGQGRFTLQSESAAVLEAYRKANPRLRVLPMPLDQAYLSINEVKPGDYDSALMPAVLAMRAVGVTKMPLLLDPKLIAQNKDLAPAAAPDGSKIFGGAMSGAIDLTTVGSCAVSQAAGSAPSFKMSDLKDYVAATATYSYQVQVKRRHKVVFHFHEFIKLIHEQSKRGGFFSTKTVNSLIDERRHTDWIDFVVDSQDGRYEYSDAYVKEVKKDFIDRALADVVALKTGSPNTLLALIEPGQNGAGAIGDGLQKCPHLYCQIGAAGFKVLDSIFGSSQAVSQLLKTVDIDKTESVTETKMVPAYGTSSFE
jgi:hypothetical protein